MQCPQCHKCWLCHKRWLAHRTVIRTIPCRHPHLVVLSLQASDAWRLEAPHDLGDGGDVLVEQPGLRVPCQNEELGALGVQRLLKETQSVPGPQLPSARLFPASTLLRAPLTISPSKSARHVCCCTSSTATGKMTYQELEVPLLRRLDHQVLKAPRLHADRGGRGGRRGSRA